MLLYIINEFNMIFHHFILRLINITSTLIILLHSIQVFTYIICSLKILFHLLPIHIRLMSIHFILVLVAKVSIDMCRSSKSLVMKIQVHFLIHFSYVSFILVLKE